jgi:hypothetical protein
LLGSIKLIGSESIFFVGRLPRIDGDAPLPISHAEESGALHVGGYSRMW